MHPHDIRLNIKSGGRNRYGKRDRESTPLRDWLVGAETVRYAGLVGDGC